MAKSSSAVEPLSEAVDKQPAAPLSESVEVSQPTSLSLIDEFHGLGGSYLLDPATGKRTLIERTEPAQFPTQPEVMSNGSDT
jgi:hypothetical protein